MDVVDTFNHLIPSDQLEDTALLGPHLESEASDEFGSGHQLVGDSLRNMLSDKDPMLGSASAQFHLLDSDDHYVAGSTELAVMNESESGQGVTGAALPRPQSQRSKARKSIPSARKEPLKTDTLQKKRSCRSLVGGRVCKQQDQESGESPGDADDILKRREEALKRAVANSLSPMLNPIVVLRRLTVTVGGFKIELLPGPSSCATVLEVNDVDVLPGPSSRATVVEVNDCDAPPVAFPEVPVETEEVVTTMGVDEGLGPTQDALKHCMEETPAELGPYVNPNEVQEGHHPIQMAEVKGANAIPNDPSAPEQSDFSNGGLNGANRDSTKAKKRLRTSADKGVADQKVPPNKLLKSKPSPVTLKQRNLTSKLAKEEPEPKSQVLPKMLQTDDSLKTKIEMAPKRRLEHLKTFPPSKIQKLQNHKATKQEPQETKRPAPPTCSPDPNRKSSAASPGVTSKSPHPPTAPKLHQPQTSPPAKPGHTTKESMEKSSQRQKSRNSRSFSLDELPLFIPDNAPVVKKEDEVVVESEAVWDASKYCNFCKKPHNNRFMVGCGRCDDWFHGECVGLDLAKAQQMEQEDEEYVCLKCCAEEDKKDECEDRDALQEPKSAVKQEQPAAGGRIARKDSVERRPSSDVKDTTPDQKGLSAKRSQLPLEPAKKTGLNDKRKSSPGSSKKPSVEQIRRNVRDSLKEILLKRLSESDLKVSTERAAHVASKTEKELFAFFRDTDSKYKNKYRSLMFNLKDAKNKVLFKRVLKGDISPQHLIRMSPEELASKELAAWRQRENRHTIEMIEREQRDVDRRPITKITHKGEIEIENEEPVKEPEAVEMELEAAAKPCEEVEVPVEEKERENIKDTTGQHKSHLFHINCKICTGRMAPPVEETTTKVMKVATTVLRRQSSTEPEAHATKAPSHTEELSFVASESTLVIPGLENSLDGRSGITNVAEDDSAFLARLNSLWKGFVNMPAVAKFLTKAYPVSGVLDQLNEDLPDSIQVGGRISPQTVWDYLEKIRATGTKEVCLIRFVPVTEEDEISYTLLYAYFSSRKRYGVIANNLKQVKDMYLIPLGSSEKIPHHLVPFDGPGLETNRPNLLLGLLIRQRVKRDFGVIVPVEVTPVNVTDLIPERAKIESTTESLSTRDEDDYLNSLKGHSLEASKPQRSTSEEQLTEDVLLPVEANLQEHAKPLRFLPGVLLGRESQPPCTPDGAGTSQSVGDPQELLGNLEKGVSKESSLNKSPSSNGHRLERFVIKKKESKQATPESLPTISLMSDKSDADPMHDKESIIDETKQEDLMADKSDADPMHNKESIIDETKQEDLMADKSDADPMHDKESIIDETKQEDLMAEEDANKIPDKVDLPCIEHNKSLDKVDLPNKEDMATEEPSELKSISSSTKNLESATLFKNIEKESEVENAQKSSEPVLQASQELKVNVAESKDSQSSTHPTVENDSSTKPKSEFKPTEDVRSIQTITSLGKKDDRPPRVGLLPTPVLPHGPPVCPFPPMQVARYHLSPSLGFPSAGVLTPPYPPSLQQMPPFNYSLPPQVIFPQMKHPSSAWPLPLPPLGNFHPSQTIALGPPLSFETPKATTPGKEEKGLERRYSATWERQLRHQEDDYRRESGESHRERKSRHHEEDHRGKYHSEKDRHRYKSRSRSRSRDRSSREHRHSHDSKHKDSQRHHGGGDRSHSDRHSDKRKDRHHNDDYGRHHLDRDREKKRDRDKHRRSSDYDSGKRRSKDRRS